MLFANTCRHHWGGSQGPLDGFQGGYSNPVLVDWDGDGRLDLIVGDMIGLFDWYPNRGSTTEPVFEAPIRLHVLGAVDGSSSEALFGPWRVQPAVGCLQRQPSVGTDVEDDFAVLTCQFFKQVNGRPFPLSDLKRESELFS